MKANRFRQDLFFRLNGVLVHVPPLRDRKGDIAPLINHFLRKFSGNDRDLTLDKDAYSCLMLYRNPGNVRELETIIRRAALFAKDAIIRTDALPEHIVGSNGTVVRLPLHVPTTAEDLRQVKEKARRAAARQVELEFLHRALKEANGYPGEATRLVGMNRSQFSRMMSQHCLGGKEIPKSGKNR